MAALYKDFPKFLITALQFKVRRDLNATYYKDLRFNYALSFDDVFYYSRLFLPYPPEFRVPSPRKATPEQNLKLAEYLVKKYERHDYPDLEDYVNTETAHPEPDDKVAQLNQDLAKLPPNLPPSQAPPPSVPKPQKVVRVPKEEIEKEKEAEETEEVPKEQVAQQPQEQPSPSQPSQPAAPPSIPQVPSPGISIPRKVSKPQEAEIRETVTQRPGLVRRGFQGVGRRITPAFGRAVGGVGNFALSNGAKLANFGADSIARLNRLRFSTASNLKKATSRRAIWIILLFLLGGGLVLGLFPGGPLNPTGQQNQVKITKTGDPVVANGAQINYQITVTYLDSGTADVEVVDTYDPNTSPIEASISDGGKIDEVAKTIKWQIKALSSGQTKVVRVATLPTKDNFWAVNNIQGVISAVTGVGGGQIASCTFYRGGDGAKKEEDAGLRFRIAEWPALINEVASKVGVPSSVIAGLLRVECPTCFYSQDPSYIRNDYDDHFSEVGGVPVAYGATQFTPQTFKFTFERNKTELQEKFSKTSYSLDINPTDRANLNNPVLRMYSIRDSIIASALKARADSGGVFDEAGVKKAVKAYYGGCEYDQGGKEWNYCEDVWKSVSQCQADQTTTVATGSGKTIILDPGHTNPDKFGEGKGDENEINLKIAKTLETLLLKNGYNIILTRSSGEGGSGYYEDLQGRIDIANNSAAQAFISIHFDKQTASTNRSFANTTLGYYKNGDLESARLAQLVSSEISKKINFRNISPRGGDYYLLNPTGAKTDCEGGKVKNARTEIRCTITTVQRSLNPPGIIQEIFPAVDDYSTLADKVSDIALGYCDGIAKFLDGKQCQP